MNVGFIGSGHIAMKMARTLAELRKTPKGKDVVSYAVAARDIDRAKAFAEEWGFSAAYGSYEELVEDPKVDLVYIATPHSLHFTHTSLALNHGKAILCEKAFTANAREAQELIDISHRKGVFMAEAVLTRFLPLSLTIREIIERGDIGTPQLLNASLCYSISHKERVIKPELCGGILLDLGVYCLNFARMCFGDNIIRTTSDCVLRDYGSGSVDMSNSIILTYADGRAANLQASGLCRCNRHGIISGSTGHLIVDNVNSPTTVHVFNQDYQETACYHKSKDQINGYEYEVLACKEALENGWIETPYMTHNETLSIMRQMDSLRKEWGVVYPADSQY